MAIDLVKVRQLFYMPLPSFLKEFMVKVNRKNPPIHSSEPGNLLPLQKSIHAIVFLHRPARAHIVLQVRLLFPQMDQQGKSGVITLRCFDLADVDDYMVWASDDRVTAFCRWDSYTDKEDLLRYMREVVLPHPWLRAICLDGRPIGSLSVELGAGCDRCKGELGYVLASGYWGRGYATAAVRTAVAAVFEEVEGLERVEALVDVQNKASQRVLEKAGFMKEGVLRKSMVLKGSTRDMVMFSLLNTDPLVG